MINLDQTAIANGACQTYNPEMTSNSSEVCAPFVSQQVSIILF